MNFGRQSLGAYGLGRRGIGLVQNRPRSRSIAQQSIWDLRDAQAIFAAEPALLGGIWLPDLAMMTQDSAGQTAAASGAVVGLVYDQSAGVKPRNIALVTNFSSLVDTTATVTNDAEYDPITGLLIADKIAATVGGTYHSKSFPITSLIKVGCRYRIGVYVKPSEYSKILVSDGSNGYFARVYDTVALTTANASGSVGAYAAGIEVVGSWFLCWLEFVRLNGNAIKISIISYPDNATINNYGAQYSGDGTSGAYFSQLSVIEIASGTHANQATAVNKPTLVRFCGDKYWFTPNSTTTALTATFPSSLGSTCTIFEAGINGVVKRTNQTIATTYNLADKPWFGSIVLNRVTTPYEDALFTRLLSSYSPKYQYNDTLSGWLFNSQEKGLILDCDDLPLMFQDASGVTPVTAMEQPVRLILDKSPNRVLARAESDAARPVLSARYNILLATETLSTQNVTTLAATYTLKFSGTGTITLSGTATGTLSSGSNSVTCTAGTLTLTVSGSVTQADLRVTNDGVGLPSYQRVTTATDYDTAGFPRYLLANGSSSSMVTPAIDFTGTNKATVWVGLRKTGSDNAYQGIVELNSSPTTTPGSFFTGTAGLPGGASRNNYVAAVFGSAVQNYGGIVTFVSPITNVLTFSFDTSAALPQNQIKIRSNGSGEYTYIGLTQATSQGNYSNGPLYIMNRGAGSFFLGRIYAIVVRGAQTSDGLIAAVEQNVNSKPRAY